MIKVFRVYQNNALISSYYNKWAPGNDLVLVEDIKAFKDICFDEKVVELSKDDFNNGDNEFVCRFRVKDDEFTLWGLSTLDTDDINVKLSIDDTMSAVAQYIRIIFSNETVSGNMARMLTTFLVNHFKKYEDVARKQKKINTIKGGLTDMQRMASSAFSNIVERGKTMEEMEVEVNSISSHGHVFSARSRRLRKAIGTYRLYAYVYAIVAMLLFLLILHFVF